MLRVFSTRQNWFASTWCRASVMRVKPSAHQTFLATGPAASRYTRWTPICISSRSDYSKALVVCAVLLLIMPTDTHLSCNLQINVYNVQNKLWIQQQYCLQVLLHTASDHKLCSSTCWFQRRSVMQTWVGTALTSTSISCSAIMATCKSLHPRTASLVAA